MMSKLFADNVHNDNKSILGNFTLENLQLSNDLLDVEKFCLSQNNDDFDEENEHEKDEIALNGVRVDSALELLDSKFYF